MYSGIRIYSLMPHCYGNGLVISGVRSRYTDDYLMGSWITIGFTNN